MGYMMDNMWGGWDGGYGGYYPFPFFAWGMMMLLWLIIFIIIGYFVYKDANSRGMNGLLWFILVIIPMIGILSLILYVIIRETVHKKQSPVKKPRWIFSKSGMRRERSRASSSRKSVKT